MNAGVAPREEGCWICRNVAHPEDVTVRVIGDAGEPLPLGDACDYVKSIGLTGSDKSLKARLRVHRGHVEAWIAAGSPLIPAHQTVGMVAVAPAGGPPAWIRAPQQAIALGEEAMTALERRFALMEDKDLIALARLGVSAAGKMADWQIKGRQMQQLDELMEATFRSGQRGRPD